MRERLSRFLILTLFAAVLSVSPQLLCAADKAIPLPEHPRPDFERAEWLNLNGPWQFAFDAANTGLAENWSSGRQSFTQSILVPFPWGSALSGLEDKAPIGWYTRAIRVPADWKGRRVFLVIGACDWETQAWLDGKPLGKHQGGYTPFEFELTSLISPGTEHRLVVRVDDTARPFKLEGKQGYGNARGIWQTVYLEARAPVYVRSLQFLPDIDRSKAAVRVSLSDPSPSKARLQLQFKTGGVKDVTHSIDEGAREAEFEVAIPSPRLWQLEDPFLYEVEASLSVGENQDRVQTYFGMRKISVVPLPGTKYPYIALNNKPVYLQISLDQSYHPQGFYTFPDDAFMREEILRSRRIGLNANRLHVKIDVPRKLYWADRLGLLIMADVPNSWSEPDSDMRREIEHALRGMIARDFNHPAIFSWVPFNETWGLFTKQNNKRVYLPETQNWVASIYRLAKQLDPTRLVEDNSPCHYDHVQTDINSWHAYLPGYAWREHLDKLTSDTFPGSKWNFIGGHAQSAQPLLNSECGNVWGYEGSAGDVDWSWDYHIMMNEFRRHPKVCGWLYTEHHDVINEWNGYYRFDRSEKLTGFDELVPGMSLRDLHGPFHISPGPELCLEVAPGQEVQVPLWGSFLTDHAPGARLQLRAVLTGWNAFGQRRYYTQSRQTIPFKPWMSEELPPLNVRMPSEPGLALLTLILEDEAGAVLHRNFTTFLVQNGRLPRQESVNSEEGKLRIIRFAPNSFSQSKWSQKQWDVLDGLKVNGAGHGFFEYRLPWPEGLKPSDVRGASLLFEASAKQLFGKDRAGSARQEGDFMLGKGTHDPSLNPNAYPMTDTVRFPSGVRVRVAGTAVAQVDLPDDPADHRGILSWHAQKRDRKLREAGSYGYLVQASIPVDAIQAAAAASEIVIRLEVDASLPGGLAIYGERFGRYPLDPTLVLVCE